MYNECSQEGTAWHSSRACDWVHAAHGDSKPGDRHEIDRLPADEVLAQPGVGTGGLCCEASAEPDIRMTRIGTPDYPDAGQLCW